MIRGRFDLIPGFTRRSYPLVNVGVILPGITVTMEALDFIVDTGATATSISVASALAPLGVPFRWFIAPRGVVGREEIEGVGEAIPVSVANAVYRFQHTNGRVQEITGFIRIADLAGPLFPPLLGWDVLGQFDLSIRTLAGEVTLTRPRRTR